MLEVVVPAREYWDETLEQFTSQDERVLQLEHSLISISKWESKWRKPFLNDDNKSDEESRDYVRCMTMTKGVPQRSITQFFQKTSFGSASTSRRLRLPPRSTRFRALQVQNR